MSAPVLRAAANLMRDQHGPEHVRHDMAEARAEAAEQALATLREDVAREIEALPEHDRFGYKSAFEIKAAAARIARGGTR